MKKTIYYSVHDCGDGSAYPIFFEDLDCAEIDQEMMEEGWGESCTGHLEIETDVDCNIQIKNVIKLTDFIKTLEDKLNNKYTKEKRKSEIEEYIKLLKNKL